MGSRAFSVLFFFFFKQPGDVWWPRWVLSDGNSKEQSAPRFLLTLSVYHSARCLILSRYIILIVVYHAADDVDVVCILHWFLMSGNAVMRVQSVHFRAHLTRATVIAGLGNLIGLLPFSYYTRTRGESVYWQKHIWLHHSRWRYALLHVLAVGPSSSWPFTSHTKQAANRLHSKCK